MTDVDVDVLPKAIELISLAYSHGWTVTHVITQYGGQVFTAKSPHDVMWRHEVRVTWVDGVFDGAHHRYGTDGAKSLRNAGEARRVIKQVFIPLRGGRRS